MTENFAEAMHVRSVLPTNLFPDLLHDHYAEDAVLHSKFLDQW